MRFKVPKSTGRFIWTNHVTGKMIFYGLSEQRIKRAILNPSRVENGIAPDTIACMQTTGSKKHPHEIWVMYQTKQTRRPKNSELPLLDKPKLTVISAWRYPGKSPAKNPIPQEILAEIQNLL